MWMKQVKILLVLSLGAFLIPNAVESRCTCIEGKIINDYCCEYALSKTKDACCHVDGLKKNPPIWVPDTGVPATPLPPRTIQPNIPPGSDDCEAKDECSRHQDCQKSAAVPGVQCECVNCNCVCEEEKAVCDPATSSCNKDADCQEGVERKNCKCVDCVCNCDMSDDECEGGDCKEAKDCVPVEEQGMMDCECNLCNCYCDVIGPMPTPMRLDHEWCNWGGCGGR